MTSFSQNSIAGLVQKDSIGQDGVSALVLVSQSFPLTTTRFDQALAPFGQDAIQELRTSGSAIVRFQDEKEMEAAAEYMQKDSCPCLKTTMVGFRDGEKALAYRIG